MSPRIGANWVTAGDALGSVNPFNGEGISLAYETGRLAADALDVALVTGDRLALLQYPERLDDIYGLYFKVARAFVRAIGNPAVMRELTRIGFHSRTLMEWILRIMANLMRPDERGGAEIVYRMVASMVRLAPERS
jgi:flavin-dependent dehydrogenase